VELVATGLAFPKGLALSPRGDCLYVAETFGRTIHCVALDTKGQGVERRPFARLQGGTGPAGLAVDGSGTLYAAHFGKG